MSSGDLFNLEVEPDFDVELVAADDIVQAAAPSEALAIMEVLPPDLDLPTLLQFIPDPRLKRDLEAEAQAALAIDVAAAGGLELADAARGRLKAGIVRIQACFGYPCDLAHRLHKRLTGLRVDFCERGEAALATLDRRMVGEHRRQQAIADEARRRAQEAADQQARLAAQRAADEAAALKAPKAIVRELQQQAKTITAPPVAAPAIAPVLAHTSVTPQWRGRFAGSPAEADPHPLVKDLTDAQRLQLLILLKAVTDGRAPIAVLKELNWGYIDRRSAAEMQAMAIPGLEAYDEGATRAKKRGKA